MNKNESVDSIWKVSCLVRRCPTHQFVPPPWCGTFRDLCEMLKLLHCLPPNRREGTNPKRTTQKSSSFVVLLCSYLIFNFLESQPALKFNCKRRQIHHLPRDAPWEWVQVHCSIFVFNRWEAASWISPVKVDQNCFFFLFFFFLLYIESVCVRIDVR